MTKLTESTIETFAIEQFERLGCSHALESVFQDEVSDKIGRLMLATKCSQLKKEAV